MKGLGQKKNKILIGIAIGLVIIISIFIGNIWIRHLKNKPKFKDGVITVGNIDVTLSDKTRTWELKDVYKSPYGGKYYTFGGHSEKGKESEFLPYDKIVISFVGKVEKEEIDKQLDGQINMWTYTHTYVSNGALTDLVSTEKTQVGKHNYNAACRVANICEIDFKNKEAGYLATLKTIFVIGENGGTYNIEINVDNPEEIDTLIEDITIRDEK